MDDMWHVFHLDVVSFVVNQKRINVLNIYLSAFEKILTRICFEISSDVFEFTKNLACIVHENRRSQQEKYKLTAWNSGQILKLSILGAASSSSVIQRLHTERGSALCELLKCCCLGTIILTTACF